VNSLVTLGMNDYSDTVSVNKQIDDINNEMNSAQTAYSLLNESVSFAIDHDQQLWVYI